MGVGCTTVRPQIITSAKEQVKENSEVINELKKLPQTPEITKAIRTLEKNSQTVTEKESNEIALGIKAETANKLAAKNQEAANKWGKLMWCLGGLSVAAVVFGVLKLFRVF